MLVKLKSYLESIQITPISWVIGISGVLMVRFFLESLSSPTSTGLFASDASTLIHYYVFFISLFLALMLFFHLALPSWRSVIPALVSLVSPLIFLAPIIDIFLTAGKGKTMTYLFDTPQEMIHSLVGFFGSEITSGLRIEVAIILLSVFALIYLVEKSFVRSVISTVCLYLIIFFLGSLPSMIAIVLGYFGDPLLFFQKSILLSETAVNNIHGSLQYLNAVRFIEVTFNMIMGKVLLFLGIILSFVWFYIKYPNKFKAFVKNSRIERVANYIFLVFLGLYLAHLLFPVINLSWPDYLSIISLALSFIFSIMFAICVNDIVDQKIDVITNASRPLVQGTLSVDDMRQVGVICLIISLIAGFLSGYTAFFFTLTFTALYYVYSAPPTRLKVIPFLSSFIIGLCCLVGVMAGFYLISPLKGVSVFPDRIALGVVVVFFLWWHIRDMKDIEGDRALGIPTVPVLFGDKWGPRVVGGLCASAFLLVPIFLSKALLFIPSVLAGSAVYYFVNKKPFSEKPSFLAYLGFIVCCFLIL